MGDITNEDALKIWLPVIRMGVENMPECRDSLDKAINALEKLEKIEELITKWSSWNADNHYVSKIREVLENE